MTWNRISLFWEESKHPRHALKINWLQLESNLREVLKDYRTGLRDADESLHMMDELIGVHTLRGVELDAVAFQDRPA